MAFTDLTLQGDHIFLRQLTTEDATIKYLSWLSDPEINQYLETRWTEQNLECIRLFIQERIAESGCYILAICVQKTGSHIGNIKLGPINKHHSFAEISYFIGDRSYWGKGFATEAIGLITDFGFSQCDLHRCEAGVYAQNRASARALEKNGYQQEGIRREQLVSGQERQDHLYFGILRSEWLEVRGQK